MRHFRHWLAAQAVAALVVAATPVLGDEIADKPLKQHGTASYYSDRLAHKKTADGSRYRQTDLTAASPSLPLGTKAKIVNKANGKSVDVRVTDRGPHKRGRIIDVSKEAADRLGMKKDGIAQVEVQARPSEQPTRALRRTIAAKARRQESAGK